MYKKELVVEMQVVVAFWLLLLAIMATVEAQPFQNMQQDPLFPPPQEGNADDPYVSLQILVPKALESINRRQDYVQALWKQVQELQQYEPPTTFNQGRFLEWILKLMQNN